MSSGSKKFKAKKKKVTKKSAKISSTTIIIVALLTVLVGGGLYLAFSGDEDGARTANAQSAREEITRISVGGPVDYTLGRVDMAGIEYEEDEDLVTLQVDDIKQNRLVSFAFESQKIDGETQNFAGEAKLPVMAMVAPSGDLMVAVSYCEPCRGTTFHTEQDGTLTCNVCGTKWDLETLTARSGACGAFPPDEIQVEVEDGTVKIPKEKLESWTPREDV